MEKVWLHSGHLKLAFFLAMARLKCFFIPLLVVNALLQHSHLTPSISRGYEALSGRGLVL